jgi:hypothetical protein
MSNRAFMKVPPRLRERARSAELDGVSGPLWTARDVLEVLGELGGSDVAVLGGDVLRTRGSAHFVHTHDNWHCDREGPGEPVQLYASRSRAVARDYVSGYPAASEEDVFFRLVLTDEPTAGLLTL